MADDPNTLYYGDKLDILRRCVDDESVDLPSGLALTDHQMQRVADAMRKVFG